jgi:MoxR-like ATPase
MDESMSSRLHGNDPVAAADAVRDAYRTIRGELACAVVGQEEVLEQLLLAILCGGHALVEGVPGLAKTLIISSLAKTLSLDFSRIQFTPDLMPSDVTGSEVIQEDRTSGSRSLRFVRGPVFANVVLADEINRTPPKTQAALLEAMQEGQVTTGGTTHALPKPFFVLATQNPIEQEGTYPLPEAQLDRFMFLVRIGYPDESQEMEIVRRTTGTGHAEPTAVLGAADCIRIQELVRQVPIADHLVRYALRLVRATRGTGARMGTPDPDAGAGLPKVVRDYVSWGAGPRASQFLVLAAKAKALLAGERHVMPAHLHAVALPVMRHRVVLNFNAQADGVDTDRVVSELLREVPIDSADAPSAKVLDRYAASGG